MFANLNPLNSFYTFVLKRVIGKFLARDLDQIDVQITQGIIELQDLLSANVLWRL